LNRFPRVLGVRYGYDPDQVDALILRIESTLGRGAPTDDPITADEIRDARFRTKLGGYNETAVDYALDAFIVAVETLTAGRRAVEARTAGHRPAEALPGAGNGPRTGTAAEPPNEPETAAVPPVQAAAPVPPAADAVPAAEDAPAVPPAVDAVLPAVDAVPPAADAGEAEEEAARIERVAFRAGRLGMGYAEEEVDLFLDRVAATLRGTTDQPVTPDDVREARFSTVVFRPGYAVSQVDDFLHDLVDVVERHLGR
jgi:DivIVA domain-containing protein